MSHSANPEMLILAREARGYTQGKLAEDTGISQANISKYESGLLRISEMYLSQIATVLHYPREFFYLSERRYRFGSSCTYQRKRQTMPVQELKTLLAKPTFDGFKSCKEVIL
jgi:transcriptional regulator with XRE-family HTH domain